MSEARVITDPQNDQAEVDGHDVENCSRTVV